MPTGDVKLPEVKLQRSNERNCTVSLLSVATTHPAETRPMEIRDAPEPEEAFVSSEASKPEPKKAESVFKDSEAAIVGRHAYARLGVESLSAVC